MNKVKPFFNFTQDPASGMDQLYIDGEIFTDDSWDWFGNGTYANKFVQKLKTCKDLMVHINSPGGDVFAGTAIYSELMNHPYKVTARITGIAASIASLIAMGADEIQISDAAYMMIHDSWACVRGNAQELTQVAQDLEEVSQSIAQVYAKRSGMTYDEVRALMKTEQLISAQRAVDMGLADTIFGSSRNQPEQLAARAGRDGPALVALLRGSAPKAPSDEGENASPASPSPNELAARRQIAARAAILTQTIDK